MVPVIRAACACTRAGESTHLNAKFEPALGTVTVHAGDDGPIDACMQNTPIGRYAPFEFGSDCIDCGPRRFGIFRGTPPPMPPPQASVVINIPFTRP